MPEIYGEPERPATLTSQQLSLFPLPVIVYDPLSLAIHDVNALAVATWAYPREQFLGLRILDTVVDAERARVVSFVAGLSGADRARSEWTMRRRDGSCFPATSYSCAIDWNGGPARLIAVEDMTVARQSEAELRFVRFMVDRFDDAIYWMDGERRIVFVNDAACRDSGYARDELLAMRLEDLDCSPYPETFDRLWARAGSGGAVRVESRHRRKDGSRYSVDVSLSRIEFGGRALIGGFARDASERKKRDRALAESEALFRETMNAAQVGIFVLQDYRFRYANPALCRWFGYAAEELVDRLGPLDLIAPDERDFVRDQMRRRAAGEPGKQYVITCVRKDGSTFPATILGAPSSFRGLPASVGTLVDLTDLREAEEQVRRLAFYDPLTSLPNRSLLADRAAQAIARAERDGGSVALVCIDLDRFKNVNDSLGHAVGDRLLAIVAERLATLVRRSDTLARLGGDEFVLLLAEASVEGAAEVARKVIGVFAEACRVGDLELAVTPSIGVSLYPEDGGDFTGLLRSADLAMYEAKDKGRNTYRFFTQAMNDEVVERVTVERQLRLAFERRELLLHYQPIVRIEDGSIVGAEALMRWSLPNRSMVPPAKFIPVAETSGLIVPIGHWAIREACRQNRAWRDAGLPEITIAVNLSAVQFYRADFVDSVAVALVEAGLPGGALELEITEGVAMEDVEATVEALRRLAALGIGLSIDDFGTGYSSLAYLKRFPIRRLKIDRSFVREIIDNADDRTIAGTVISMGHSLRHTIVAEGVETGAQRALLAEQGCDFVQGFLFSPAVPPADFAELLGRGRIAPSSR